MTEGMHPVAIEAAALAEDARFCDYLDSRISTSRSNSWPHSRTSARQWLEEQCGIESLGHLATDPAAAVAFGQIARHFAAWDLNGELEV